LCFGDRTESSPKAKVNPPAKGQKILLFRFWALDAGVVFTVSVEVCATEPLIVTEVGLRLHVGMSLTFVNAVVTLQVRSTTPPKPFIPATLMVPVFPVVAPGVTVKDVVPPDPGATPGSAMTLRSTVVVALSEAEVPVTVIVTAPEVIGADAVAVRVNT
jgi:hypothetical protein